MKKIPRLLMIQQEPGDVNMIGLYLTSTNMRRGGKQNRHQVQQTVDPDEGGNRNDDSCW